MTTTTKTKPGLLLAQTWDGEQDVRGWWLSEKLDGVRAYWDGARFWSRDGNPFHAPAWFTGSLPTIPLDGELWTGRKQFQRTVGIVRRKQGGEAWRAVQFIVFDAPACGLPFEERARLVWDELRTSEAEYARPLTHQVCRGTEHLRSELAAIEAQGGEGLMLRQPGSRYETGRSGTLLKVKTFHDAEAVVVGHEPGRGKHAGRLGALVCATLDGRTFAIGTGFSDQQRQTPPPIGTLVTFRYQELTDAGLPRFPSFVRIRT